MLPALPSFPLADGVVIGEISGITTAIVVFIFACVAFPHLVKNKTQFYAAFAAVLIIILLHSLNIMIGTAGFQVFAGALTGLLQLGAIVLLFAGCGGMSISELAGEMKGAYDDFRGGGTEEKTVIVPLSGEMPRPRQQPASSANVSVEAPPAEKIDLPPNAGWPTKTPQGKSDDSSIPLE
jgi:hypothetical protein